MAYNKQVRNKFGYFDICGRVSYKMLLWIYLFCFLCVYNVSTTDYCKDHFDNCICTDAETTCHKESKLYGDITKLFHYIKDDITMLNVTGCKLKELPKNTFGSCREDTSLVLKQLKLVDLSDNEITRIHGKSFHCVPNIETLILNDNEWEVDKHEDEVGYFTSIDSLKHLYMNNTFKEVWDGAIHLTKLANVFMRTDMAKLETLKMGHNEFMSFSLDAANSLCQLTSLKTLDLSHNNIDDPNMPTENSCLVHLESLDLSYNKMRVLSQHLMSGLEKFKNLKQVKLDNNMYMCDGGLRDTWTWLNSTKVPVNKHEMTCAGGYHSSYIGKPILTLALSDLRDIELDPPSNTAVKAVVGIIFAVIGLTLIAFLIVHRENVRLVFKKWKKRLPNVAFRSHQGYASVQEVAVI